MYLVAVAVEAQAGIAVPRESEDIGPRPTDQIIVVRFRYQGVRTGAAGQGAVGAEVDDSVRAGTAVEGLALRVGVRHAS